VFKSGEWLTPLSDNLVWQLEVPVARRSVYCVEQIEATHLGLWLSGQLKDLCTHCLWQFSVHIRFLRGISGSPVGGTSRNDICWAEGGGGNWEIEPLAVYLLAGNDDRLSLLKQYREMQRKYGNSKSCLIGPVRTQIRTNQSSLIETPAAG